MIQRLKIRALIKHKGGATKVAALCGVSQPSVSKWAAQGSIPVQYAILLEQLWGIDADLMHNPWGLENRVWVSDAEQAAIIGGDYEFRLEAPRRIGRTYAEEPLVDLDEPVEIEPFPDGYEDDDEDEVPAPPVDRGRVPSDDEIEAILKELNNDREG